MKSVHYRFKDTNHYPQMDNFSSNREIGAVIVITSQWQLPKTTVKEFLARRKWVPSIKTLIVYQKVVSSPCIIYILKSILTYIYFWRLIKNWCIWFANFTFSHRPRYNLVQCIISSDGANILFLVFGENIHLEVHYVQKSDIYKTSAWISVYLSICMKRWGGND